jgi:hypothetical protein
MLETAAFKSQQNRKTSISVRSDIGASYHAKRANSACDLLGLVGLLMARWWALLVIL